MPGHERGTMDRMPHRFGSALPVVLVAGACVVSGCGGVDGKAVEARWSAPPAEHPLLGPPDPAAPTRRGVFLKDPKGHVERIAAGGHLVAWSVRTPADKLAGDDDDVRGEVPPKRMPTSTKVVIVDERAGAPITVDLGRRWVSQLRMVRGPGGPAEPQLAVESCGKRVSSSCTVELLTLSPSAPLQVTARRGGADAAAAIAGSLDSGRRLQVRPRKGRSCAARISVREHDGIERRLPRLPTNGGAYRLDDLDTSRSTGVASRRSTELEASSA